MILHIHQQGDCERGEAEALGRQEDLLRRFTRALFLSEVCLTIIVLRRNRGFTAADTPHIEIFAFRFNREKLGFGTAQFNFLDL